MTYDDQTRAQYKMPALPLACDLHAGLACKEKRHAAAHAGLRRLQTDISHNRGMASVSNENDIAAGIIRKWAGNFISRSDMADMQTDITATLREEAADNSIEIAKLKELLQEVDGGQAEIARLKVEHNSITKTLL